MSERLCSVGLDVGTTSTQLIVSELTVENQASAFSVPRMEIGERNVRYRSPVYFTPLLDESHVDGQKIREIVELEYQKAGISRDTVDTGAIIITGETSRKENARAVLDALADLAGDFVVATAGPDLESILAAKGAGAEEFSRETGKPVVHMDIGGGTSNLSLIEEGKVVQTGCLNVGGRLVKLDDKGVVLYRSPVLEGLCDWKIGQTPTPEELENLAQMLTQALEMAVGLRPPGPLLERLSTQEAQQAYADNCRNLIDAATALVEVNRNVQETLAQIMKRQEEFAQELNAQKEKLEDTCENISDEVSSQLYTFTQTRSAYEK